MTGRTIKWLREQRNWTQAMVSGAIGVAQQTVCNWEASKGEPDASDIRKLARLFGVDANEIVGSPEALAAEPAGVPPAQAAL